MTATLDVDKALTVIPSFEPHGAQLTTCENIAGLQTFVDNPPSV